MTQILYSGQTASLVIPKGQSIIISTEAGVYSATLTTGANKGLVLASNSMLGSLYGPYVEDEVVELVAGEGAIVSFKVGNSPILNHKPVAVYSFDIDGVVNGLIAPDGSIVALSAGNIATDSGKNAKIQYGTIRQTTDAGGWTFINDATHQYAGFTDAITVVSGNLVVPYNSTATKVGTLVAVPDETFAALGLELGASVGLTSATISLYKPLYVTVDLATLVCTPSPFFTGTVSAVNNGNGTVTITHPTVGATGALATVDNKTKYKTTLTSSAATTTTVESIVEFGGNISYDGTNWVVTTPTFLKPTMVFSAGTLTVTHNVFGAADANVVVTTRDNATTLCTMGNATSTNFTVVFRDYTGALITTPSTDMKFFYQGTQMMTRETPIGQILLTRNHCKLDANNFFAASGNIWLMGASNV